MQPEVFAPLPRLSDAEIATIEYGEWKNRVTPFDFSLSANFCGSRFGKYEIETVASSIITLLQNLGNGWGAFTQQEYARSIVADEPITASESAAFFTELDEALLSDAEVFDNLILLGCLTKTGEGKHCLYEVTEEFIKMLQDFIVTPERQAAAKAHNEERILEEAKVVKKAILLLADLPPQPADDLLFVDLEMVVNAHEKNGFKLSLDQRHGRTFLYLERPDGGSGNVGHFVEGVDVFAVNEAARACYAALRTEILQITQISP